jgi:hypothetical protein
MEAQRIPRTFEEFWGELVDWYDSSRADERYRSGVLRYLYPASELITMIKQGGFCVTEAKHWASDHYLLVGAAAA